MIPHSAVNVRGLRTVEHQPATPGRTSRYIPLQPEYRRVIDVAKLVDKQSGEVGQDRLFGRRLSPISLKGQIYVNRHVNANPRSRFQNMLQCLSPSFGPCQVLLVSLVVASSAVVLAKVIWRAGYDQLDATRR